MGQVPNKTYGIIGSGKTARHIKYYLQSQSILVKSWSRSENKNTPEEALHFCDVILVLIKDSEIAQFISENPFLKTKQLVHFSGSLVLPDIPSTHPLMTFGDQLYSLETYKKITFVCEKGKTSFKELFPHLENTFIEIESTQKPLYHSMCVLSGNFTTILWKKFFDELEKMGIPAEAAFPYMDKIVENLKKNPQTALTGPLARRDKATIQTNLDSLEGDQFKKVYQTFVEIHDPKLLDNEI